MPLSTLKRLAAQDPVMEHRPQLIHAGTRLDHRHAERRCQQRAISDVKIAIALVYGHHEFHHGHDRWTIDQRALADSPYQPHSDALNGLQVVGLLSHDGETGADLVTIKTCKWVWRLKRA